MYDNVLVPTDGSECANAAVDHALTLAERFDATLHALYVVDVRATHHSAPELGMEQIRESLEAQGEEATEYVASRARERGVNTVEAVEEGTPEDVIEEYVDTHDVDVVVMGTHGRTGLDRFLLGSVTERIVRTSDVPVLTVGGAESE
ncbi:MAG: universal stress protein [Haloferacaceae archaeon]